MNALPANPLTVLPANSGSVDNAHVLTAFQTNTSAWAKRAQPPHTYEPQRALRRRRSIPSLWHRGHCLQHLFTAATEMAGTAKSFHPSYIRAGERPRDVRAKRPL